MSPARRSKALLLATCLAAGSLLPPSTARAEAPSPCQLEIEISLGEKLVCPFTAVETRMRLQARCPQEDGGMARVLAVELNHALPAGIRITEGERPFDGGAQGPSWRIAPFPAEGITLTHQVLPIRPGSYPLDEGLAFRIEDDRGRLREQAATRPSGNGELTVSAGCYGQRRSTVYLPLLHQPRCTPRREPADIVLAIDRSTSLGQVGGLDARRHARALLDSLHLGRDRLALLGFDQRAELLAPLGSDRAALEAAIEGLRPGPGTEIDRAIELATRVLAGSRERRRVLVLITDGVQTGPRDRDRVLAAAADARAEGLQILTAAVGRAPDLALLRALGGGAEGRLVTAGDPDLAQAYRELGEWVACAP